jgi:predicted O-methyltransferase YrrM
MMVAQNPAKRSKAGRPSPEGGAQTLKNNKSFFAHRVKALHLIATYASRQVFAAVRGEAHLLGQVHNLAWMSSSLKKLPSASLEELFPGINKFSVELEPRGSDGSVNLAELCDLASLCRSLRPRAVFEFGTLNGRTTTSLAANAPADARIYTLDLPPEEQATLLHAPGDELYRPNWEGTMHYAKSAHGHKVVQIWSDSAKFDAGAFAGSIDVVFIDGSHSYEYVRNDSEKALQMISSGGVIVWHDYTVFWPGVIQYLHELAAVHPVKHIKGTRMAILVMKG